MFLSKLFSIFKKKKDNQAQASTRTKPAASPPGSVGAAVGLSQPNQSVAPDSGKVAQGPSEPDMPKADVDSAEGAVNPQPTTVPPAPEEPAQAPVPPIPTDTPQPSGEEPVPQPEQPAPTPEDDSSGSSGSNLGGDDSQNISV